MLIRNSALYLAANGVSAILGFAGMFLYTRLLEPGDFGIYVIGNTLAGIVSALMFTWLRHSTVRFQSEGRTADVRLTALAGYGGILLIMPAALVAIAVVGRVSWSAACVAVLISASMGFFDLAQDILRARQLANRAMLGVMARAAISLAAGLLAISLGAGGIGLLIALSTAYIAAASLIAPWSWQKPLAPVSTVTLKQMALFGGPITVSGFIFAIHSGLDRLIVGSVLGTDAAGQYGASADFVRQCMIYPAMSASAAIGPMAIQLMADQQPVALKSHLERSAELLLAVVLPAAVGLAIASHDLSLVVLGAKYRDAGSSVMPLLALSWVAYVIAHHYAHLSFSLANRPRQYIVHAAITLAISAALMYPLVKLYGLVGAASALLVAEIGSAIVGLVMTRSSFRLPLPIDAVGRVLVAVAIMAAAAACARAFVADEGLMRLIVVVVCGVAGYGAAAFTLNILNCRNAGRRWFSRWDARRRLV
jgi:O-antigen/teichoic acid export membrane protein